MHRKQQNSLLTGIIAGVVSGLALGLLFRAVERLFEVKVYTLLLNVDFVPFLPQPLPEWIEFMLHMAVSVFIGMLYSYLLGRSIRRSETPRPVLYAAAAALVTIPLFIPLTLLSDRTPAITDMAAFAWWIAGHGAYGFILALFGMYQTRNLPR
ncbi:hypothetical protein [Paenibacillus turpanensis]|uniref:hypothetical protein n=1 Tax=Paenibacillus turpanensis TaxID=2689078 RepID=UPI001FB72E9F|nr:hypothetical protein [Paenibacillus turpanensis]